MIFTTHYYMPNGTKWSGPRLRCLCWSHAEFIASIKGVDVTGRLHAEIDEYTGHRIDYDLPMLNMKRFITGAVVFVATIAVIGLILVGIARQPSGRDYSGYGSFQDRRFNN